jgi:hypothetical protein
MVEAIGTTTIIIIITIIMRELVNFQGGDKAIPLVITMIITIITITTTIIIITIFATIAVTAKFLTLES